MATPQQNARRQQQVEELCAAALRALAGDTQLHYRGGRLYRAERRLPVHAPHLRVEPEHDDFPACRAAADGTSLRLRHSDATLHRQFCPLEPVERLIFELLEQLRVETLVSADMPGMAHNLQQRFDAWSRAFYRSGLTENEAGILLYTTAQMCWSRLNACAVLAETEDYIESTRWSLVSELGGALSGIRRERHDQASFAPHARAIARIVAARVHAHAASGDEERDEEADASRTVFSLLLDFDEEDGGEETMAAAVSGESKVFGETEQAYRVFTTRYDCEQAAGELVRQAQLEEFRDRLDRLVAQQGINIPRLARLLGSMLSEPRRDGWRFGEEEGQLDGRRLTQLITSPAERRLFLREQFKPVADCQVSFLVDCSGSMKAHIEQVTTLLDILLRALEMAGVRTELLGFTTSAWNGGRPYREWMSQGRPRHPGRLNEVCHLVFKDATRSWRRARRDIAALLKPELFREGIDGEAVDWACQRLLASGASRRILIVISDGSPADSATGLANDTFYLNNHLKAVVARREQEGAVDILGLGVGLDLSPFYRRCLATDMSQPLDNALCLEIVRLIGGRHRR